MTTQTLWADVMDAIYDKWVADTTLAGLVTAGTLVLWDGPPVGDRSTDVELILGAVGDEFEVESGTVGQDWATAGGAGYAERDENIDIPCCVWVWRGETDMRTCRRQAVDVFNPAATALRGQTLSVPQLMWLETAAGGFTQAQTEAGVAVLLKFTIRARTRL